MAHGEIILPNVADPAAIASRGGKEIQVYFQIRVVNILRGLCKRFPGILKIQTLRPGQLTQKVHNHVSARGLRAGR